MDKKPRCQLVRAFSVSLSRAMMIWMFLAAQLRSNSVHCCGFALSLMTGDRIRTRCTLGKGQAVGMFDNGVQSAQKRRYTNGVVVQLVRVVVVCAA